MESHGYSVPGDMTQDDLIIEFVLIHLPPPHFAILYHQKKHNPSICQAEINPLARVFLHFVILPNSFHCDVVQGY